MKEVYIEKIESRLAEYSFELQELKNKVEKNGKGNSSDWLKDLQGLRELEEEIRAHIWFLRRTRNQTLRTITKTHIEKLVRELREEFHQIAKEYDYKPLTDDV